MLYLARLLV